MDGGIMSMTGALRHEMSQTMTLSPQMRQGLKMLSMNLPELRAELYREMDENPCIDDVEQTLTGTTVEEAIGRKEQDEAKGEEFPDEDYRPEFGTAAPMTRDVDADERRQRFFDSQTKEESLEEHLINQLPSSGIDDADIPLAEILIGELDDDGRFTGSIPDIVMATGASETKIREILRAISDLDPAGCGTTSLKDCLLAQMDKLDGSPYQNEVRELIESHLEDVAANRFVAIERGMGISLERYSDLLEELRTLEPRPGRAYSRSGREIAYINPEVHAMLVDGRWIARVDDRSLPDIRISPKYVKMLSDPGTDKETKEYLRGKIAAAEAISDAVERRQETLTNIAQAIFDAQPGYFVEGEKGIKPLTMEEIAKKTGVHHATVSRAVRGKYASTPRGTIELRRFFVHGVATEDGGIASKCALDDSLRAIVNSEDKSHPFSDEKLAEILKSRGFSVARRTVAKYRGQLGIPGASERKS